MHICGRVGVQLPLLSVAGPRLLPGNSRYRKDLENQWNPVKCAGHSVSRPVFRKASMITASTPLRLQILSPDCSEDEDQTSGTGSPREVVGTGRSS